MVVKSILKQYLFLHHRRMMRRRKRCLVPQGEIRRGLLKCVLILPTGSTLPIHILEWNLDFDMYTEVMSIDNG